MGGGLPEGHKEMLYNLADQQRQIATSYTSPYAGGWGVPGSQPMSTAVHIT
jgi:hypothetical protein